MELLALLGLLAALGLITLPGRRRRRSVVVETAMNTTGRGKGDLLGVFMDLAWRGRLPLLQ